MKLGQVNIVGDGTTRGTRVYLNGDVLNAVAAVRREGRNTFITIRVRDADVDIVDQDGAVEGDFALAVKPQPAIPAGQLLR